LTSRFMGSRWKKFAGKSVLELGCGLGLCGIVAGIKTYLTKNGPHDSSRLPLPVKRNVYCNLAFHLNFALSWHFVFLSCSQSEFFF
jgi:hypothetical protein